MDRGVSSGGGQSSLDYLFGRDAALKSAEKLKSVQKPTPLSSADKLREIPTSIQSSKANNYYRSEGQNCGNVLTDRPSTKVQGPLGGDSQLNYSVSFRWQRGWQVMPFPLDSDFVIQNPL